MISYCDFDVCISHANNDNGTTANFGTKNKNRQHFRYVRYVDKFYIYFLCPKKFHTLFIDFSLDSEIYIYTR